MSPFDRCLAHEPGEMIICDGLLAVVCANHWHANYRHEEADMKLLFAVDSGTIRHRSLDAFSESKACPTKTLLRAS